MVFTPAEDGGYVLVGARRGGLEAACFDDVMWGGADVMALIRAYATPYVAEFNPENSMLARNRAAIDRHFAHGSMPAIVASLESDDGEFSQKTLASLNRGSPWELSSEVRI